VPAFIVTLAGMLFFRGANQAVGQSTTVAGAADFQFIGAGYLPSSPSLDFNVLTMLLAVLGGMGGLRVAAPLAGKAGTGLAPVWVSA
jgi:putative multiple sugar transport system permease protein